MKQQQDKSSRQRFVFAWDYWELEPANFVFHRNMTYQWSWYAPYIRAKEVDL